VVVIKRSLFWDIPPCSRFKADIFHRNMSGATFFALVSFLASSPILKIEAMCSSETSAGFQHTTRCHFPEDRAFYFHMIYLITSSVTQSTARGMVPKLQN
jgi:hypothetical protein